MTIDEEGIKSASALAETRFRWPMMAYWAETANLFVLRLNTKSLLVIPKRAATSEQLEQLRKSFGERIVAPAKGFPVVMAKANGGGREAAK
ncbi:MAG: YcxB family protein [Tepidisphaeraceae bacterium]